MSSNKTPAKRGTTAVANFDYGDYAGHGTENVTSDDLVLPFLGILQSNSPQVVEDVGNGGIEGAKMGMLYNTVTDDIFDGKAGVLFTPSYTERCFVEWVPRDKGGGFVGVHKVDSPFVKQARKDSDSAGMKFGKVFTSFDGSGEPNGNQLTETFYVYGVIRTDENSEPTPVVIAFTSTKITVYKRWMTKVEIFAPRGELPLCAHNVRLTTKIQKNAQGTFGNFDLKPASLGESGQPSIGASLLTKEDPTFLAAHSVYEMVTNGMARVSYETQEKGTGDGGPTAAIDNDGDPHF